MDDEWMDGQMTQTIEDPHRQLMHIWPVIIKNDHNITKSKYPASLKTTKFIHSCDKNCSFSTATTATELQHT